MKDTDLSSTRLWYGAAILFAMSAIVLFFHRDIVGGCFWLVMSALGVIFGQVKTNGRAEECHGHNKVGEMPP